MENALPLESVDRQIAALFARRMQASAAGAPPPTAAARAALIRDAVPEDMREYAYSLFSLLDDLCRAEPAGGRGAALRAGIERAVAETPALFPTQASVACQGVEGAYSQLACDRLFRHPEILYFSTFEAVFSAIENGLCRYGVVPVENSTAGSVNAVYDLMMRRRFRIVRSVRLKVDHNLLALPGARLSDIREIYSHEQAISQCGAFLQTLPGVKVVRCENTAAAAKAVAESGRTDAAALASRACIPLYHLSCLAPAVQDQGGNFTRFVCISRELEIYPGADRTSLMMVLPHRPGSLYEVLARFYARGMNLIKLESRPMPDRNFEFMFYFDLEAPVYSPQFLRLMSEMDGISEDHTYFGSYSEIV